MEYNLSDIVISYMFGSLILNHKRYAHIKEINQYVNIYSKSKNVKFINDGLLKLKDYIYIEKDLMILKPSIKKDDLFNLKIDYHLIDSSIMLLIDNFNDENKNIVKK